MRKPVIVAAVALVIVAIGIGGGFFFAREKQISSPVPSEEGQVSEAMSLSKTTKKYTDPSGFQFSYPDNLNLSKKEVTDTSVYSNIQITSPDTLGSIVVNVADDKSTSIDAWVKANKKLASFVSAMKEVTLASLPARQIRTNDSLVTAALDQGVIFAIEVFPQDAKEYWQTAYDTIIKSFAFVSTQPAATTPGGSSQPVSTSQESDIIFEGEETVE